MDLRSFEAKGLRVEARDRIVVVSLSTPPNRFTLALIEGLSGLAQEMRTRTDIRCVWLRAEGADFSHGADLRDPTLGALVMVIAYLESIVFDRPFLISISSIGERQLVGGLSNLTGLPLNILSP